MHSSCRQIVFSMALSRSSCTRLTGVAVPTSPLSIGDGLIFLTSCYEADTVMIRVKRDGEIFKAEKFDAVAHLASFPQKSRPPPRAKLTKAVGE